MELTRSRGIDTSVSYHQLYTIQTSHVYPVTYHIPHIGSFAAAIVIWLVSCLNSLPLGVKIFVLWKSVQINVQELLHVNRSI